MRSLVLLSCLLLAVAGQEEGCSMDDFLRCDREIQKILEECAHVTTMAEWQTCLNDLIYLVVEEDCLHCFCDQFGPQFPQFC